MIKIVECKQLNWIEHYEALKMLENKQVNKVITSNNITENSTIELLLKDSRTVIIHKSSKKYNMYQVSFFDKIGAISDKEVSNIKNALLLFNNYNIVNVI